MEVKEKSKKRELIKTIAIIFLVILLILTFFSNTFMNYSLPEVATQVVTSGTINAKIRGSGTVAANESYEVVIDQTREVRSVCVKVGDTVQQGDLLFVLGDMESEELKAAQEALQTAQLEYQRKILNLSKDYATNDMNVRNIQAALEKAIAERDASIVTETEISYAKGDVAAAESQLSQVKLMIEELEAIQASGKDEDSKYAEAAKKVEELEAKVKELTDKITGLNDEIKKKEEELNSVETGSDLKTDRAIQDAKNALDKAETKWAADWAANAEYLNNLHNQGYYSQRWSPRSPHIFSSSEQIAIEGALGQMKLREDNSWMAQANAQDLTGGNTDTDSDNNGDNTTTPEPKKYYSETHTAYTTILSSQTAMETAQETYNRAVEDKNASANTAAQDRQKIQQQINTARSEISTVQAQLSMAQSQLTQAKAEKDAATNSNSQIRDQVKTYQSSERDLTARVDELKADLAELEEKKTAFEAAEKEIETQQKALEEALSGKDIDKQLNNLDLESMRLDIEKQQALVAKYREQNVDTEIKSNVSGIISAINVTAGKDNTAGQAMATIDVVDRGFTIKVSVTNEQAKQVKVGDTAEVTNYRWGSDIIATLEAIISDQSAPGQKKVLVFRVTGDVEAGATISLSIGQRSTVSDTVVPKSALREDTNGKFVFVVTSKSTPLGNRYTATRVDVQVLAEDDTNAAVSGIAANDYVITTSSKPLTAGDLVRMVENP